ncbi:MAG TPA: DUF92 domain-containing protein [Edaphobacter sp.]|jgi:uncharacterized protein (TIGR00297 family)|nr:DUF92 domain-containing protein [Edaphobacter sp.]
MNPKPDRGPEMTLPFKSIPVARDKVQSTALVWTFSILLSIAAIALPLAAVRLSLPLWPLARPLLLSAAFAALVYLLRAATLGASILGFLVCFILAQSPAAWSRYLPDTSPHPLFVALIVLFALTYAATKFGRARKEAHGLSEPRHGRQASQIVANLGIAALFAAAGRYDGCVAALAEVTADTVSSEVGQAIGHSPRLLTTGRLVPPGTDGAITTVGTLTGIAAAAIVIAIGAMRHPFWPTQAVLLGAATAGLFFDSLLGATVERRGWFGNDLVNLTSTLVAALIASSLR